MEISFFNTLSLLALLSATCVVTSKNPMHSILFLVLVFFNIAGLLVLLGVDFLAMLLLIVYVGAVAVLFLFVIMMLNVKISSTFVYLSRYLPIGLSISLVFLFEFYSMIEYDLIAYNSLSYGLLNDFVSWVDIVVLATNTTIIGTVLYTYYCFLFIICGYILLISMIGSITLTLFRRCDVRRQDIYKQMQASFSSSIKFNKR
jgi:NADH-quinone oxidoreductase subunit J